jgi:ArsR family transcriptional regulator
MFGAGFFFHAFPALLDPDWLVADLGCGTGRVTEALAPFVRKVIAVDDSDEMLEEARRRLEGLGNVDCRKGSIEQLPIEDRALDAATLVLVLHHLPEPEQALAEVARVLKPGGRLLVVDTLPHDREEYAQAMGHIWLGFSEETVRRHLEHTGFEASRVVRLAADPRAKGPALFAAAAVRSARRGRATKIESRLETSGKGGVS